MSARLPQPVGFARTEPWPLTGAPAEWRSARSDEVLVRITEGTETFLALNPYSGCEFACTYCRARQLPPFVTADWRVFERDIHARVNAPEALTAAARSGALRGLPLVLGTTCDPWQPAERRALLTRRVLETLVRVDGVELRAQTRSTLAARDADLLAALSRRGKVSVTFSLATLDFKLGRLLEPLAPTSDRRLVALEALARAGVEVGILVAPVLAGLNDSLPALEALLRRARDAGARFAGCAPLAMGDDLRRKLVRFVARHDPELATRYNRLLARSVEHDPQLAGKLERRFGEACKRIGLEHAIGSLRGRIPPAKRSGAPAQLSLF